jgi:AbrB family looped-hinge helix DNA binding protein
MPTSTLSSKGEITIPLEIRVKLGLRDGDQVAFFQNGPDVVIRPVRSSENPFLEFVGAVPAFANVQEVNAWVASIRDDAD